jgi:CDP-paratose 2-epimerase
MDRLNAVTVDEAPTRYEWRAGHGVPGLSEFGVSEDFPLDGVRSFYGASKLASELLLQEYRYACGLPALINRCGVIAGPWQMGKVDQGVVALWVARHAFGKPIAYTGFGGSGKQVRDVLHVDDLAELILKQCAAAAAWNGQVYNVGGGNKMSVSLVELTALCEDVTGQRLELGRVAETSPMDVRIYVSDTRKVREAYNWRPARPVRDIVGDVYSWIVSNRDRLAPIRG